MTKNKLQVGQKIFVKPVSGQALSYSKEISEHTIEKIGKKYFTLKDFYRGLSARRFIINTMQDDSNGYSANYTCYTSIQEINDENEFNELKTIIRKTFDVFTWNEKLTLEKLRKIKQIITEENLSGKNTMQTIKENLWR